MKTLTLKCESSLSLSLSMKALTLEAAERATRGGARSGDSGQQDITRGEPHAV